MKKHQNLKAFTLVELVVVMILSSVIATIAFFSIQNVQSQYSNFEQQTDTVLEISHFQTVLASDFEQSKLVHCEENSLHLIYENYKIQYQFAPSWVTRSVENQFIDTLRIPSSLVSFYYKSKLISQGRVDKFQLKYTLFKNPYQQILEKEYSSETLWSE